MVSAPLFALGERVMTKTLSVPAIGRIVSIIDPSYFIVGTRMSCKRYDERFPGWREEPIYNVLYDSPLRNVSRDEFMEGREDEDQRLVDMQFKLFPAINPIGCPEQDLERFEE